MSVPLYLAESSPASMRGKLVVLYVVFITGGQFLASVVDGAFSEVPEGWRWVSLSLSLLELCKELQLVWLARPDFLYAHSEHYVIQWNLSIVDTIGTQLAVLFREVFLIQRLICTQLNVVGTAGSVLIRGGPLFRVSFI